jgi:hypothetical protein
VFTSIYRDCSIPLGFAELDPDMLENARKSICSELTRTYADTLQSFASCRGYLALDMPTSAASQSAAMLGISTDFSDKADRGKKAAGGGKKGKGKAKEAQREEPEEALVVSSVEGLALHKALRRRALHFLIMGNPCYQQAITAPFAASVAVLIGLPDSAACRKGIALGDDLALQSRRDGRLVSVVGKDAFSAALFVLLQEESWSEGLELEVIDFLVSVYGVLVFGETLTPDGTILAGTPVSADSKGGSSSSAKSKGPKNGGQGGFGSMSQWSGSTGSGNSGGRNNSKVPDSKGGPQISDVDTTISTLPRQVLMMYVSSQIVENLEKQMLGTTSKKKRRDYFKDMLKAAGAKGTGSVDAKGKRVDAAVLDIRKRLAQSSARPSNGGKAPSVGLRSSFSAGGLDGNLNLSSFFGE